MKTTRTSSRQRLEHVDAMRPIKQFGVVLNHSIIFFVPSASLLASCSVLLLHVTREAFIFISACMLTYAYPYLRRQDLRQFYSRRFMSVGIPYVCWTIIYFFLSFKDNHYTFAGGLSTFRFDLLTGYYQLYFLVILIQFYAVYPLLQKGVAKLHNYHVALLVVSLVVQVIYTSLMHWNQLPYWLQDNWANRELVSYQFYILSGMVVAYHFEAFHKWVIQYSRYIYMATLASAMLAIGWVVIIGVKHLTGLGLERSDPFQPIIIPFNISAILSVYLLGIWLVDHAPQSLIRRLTASGAENSYGIYTAQLVLLNGLLWVNFGTLRDFLPWWLVVIMAAIIAFIGSWMLTAVLARTPLAQALTGRRRQSWASFRLNTRITIYQLKTLFSPDTVIKY